MSGAPITEPCELCVDEGGHLILGSDGEPLEDECQVRDAWLCRVCQNFTIDPEHPQPEQTALEHTHAKHGGFAPALDEKPTFAYDTGEETPCWAFRRYTCLTCAKVVKHGEVRRHQCETVQRIVIDLTLDDSPSEERLPSPKRRRLRQRQCVIAE